MQDRKVLQFIGRRIRSLREALGLSQEDFAHLCGLDRTYISGIERGLRNVSLINIEIIAESLGISIYDLFLGYEGQFKQLEDETESYLVRPNAFISCGFDITVAQIATAINRSTTLLQSLPFALFASIDLKATSGMIGAIFISSLAEQLDDAVPNPIEKGHPDIIPKSGLNATEAQLRNYGIGLEVKCTIGNVAKGALLSSGQQRIDLLTGLTWQAHHREVGSLLGLVWDFAGQIQNDKKYPIITGAFYSASLTTDDWGVISGTTGRNTKVTGMKVSGKRKMGEGWLTMLNDDVYIEKYQKALKFQLWEG